MPFFRGLRSDRHGSDHRKPQCNKGDRMSPPALSLHPGQCHKVKRRGTNRVLRRKGVQDDRADRDMGMVAGRTGKLWNGQGEQSERRSWLSDCVRYVSPEQGLKRAAPKDGGARGDAGKASIEYLEDFNWNCSSESPRGWLGRKGAR